jgi:hypothetical protein
VASGVPAEVSGILPHIDSPAPQTQAIVNDCSLHPLVPELPFGGVGNSGKALNRSDDPEARRLARRLTNLGVDRYTVWARGQAGSVLDAIHEESILRPGRVLVRPARPDPALGHVPAGRGLIAGKISPEPALLRFAARISEEGGADVPATWASPR